MLWQCAEYSIDVTVPRIMAVINLTADSFSDGGEYLDATVACKRIEVALKEGADILDLGAESSRPGAQMISEEVEWARLEPVLKHAVKYGVPVSVDTCKPAIMERAIAYGAAIINDIQGLRANGAVACVARSQVGVCLMHMQGAPQTMQRAPQYEDVVNEIKVFLAERIEACYQAGIALNRIALDPGIGFGKSLTHNIKLLAGLRGLPIEQHPVLIGVSRKSMIGALTGQEQPKDRMAGSIAAALYAVSQGARILRVHDVRATADALKVWNALSVV